MRMVAGRGEGKIPLSVQVEGGVSEHRACEAKVSSRCGQCENGEASGHSGSHLQPQNLGS